MKEILNKYVGEEIGINISKPFDIEGGRLVDVAVDHFSIEDSSKGYTHHFLYNSIVQVIENEGGIDVGGMFKHTKHFTVVIKVGHLVEYLPV